MIKPRMKLPLTLTPIGCIILHAAGVLATSASDATPAKYTPITAKQIAKHLGLSGGNFTAEFDQPCYQAFILTETSQDGTGEPNYEWNLERAKAYEFYWMHHREDAPGPEDRHEISYGFYQTGEWEELASGNGRHRSGQGGGSAASIHLPTIGSWEMTTADLQIKLNEPVALFTWKAKNSPRSITLRILFSPEKKLLPSAPEARE